MVTGQDSFVLQIPLRSNLVAGCGTDTRLISPVILDHLTVDHQSVTGRSFRRSRIETAVHMDTTVNLERSVQHRATAGFGRFGRHIRTCCHIYRTRRQVVDLHVVAQVIDSVLQAVLRCSPTQTIVIIRTGRTDIANSIRLRVRIYTRAH